MTLSSPAEFSPQPGASLVMPPRPALARSGVWRERFDLLLLVVLVFTLVNLASMRFYIEGPSMQPNFSAGQFLIVSRAHYLLSQPQRGDIVVFDAPGDDNTRDNPLLIKRLIGLPGDHIVIENGTILLNDVLLSEPYINQDGRPFRCNRYCDVVLGADEYFLMGDNRNNSNDSREFGPVARVRIMGEAILRYWPFDAIGNVTRVAFP
ncbi:MAG: signal peptidase I [Pleurocapsa minor GSE-CHR-MK-17-07R]|jgi:signal peptidase I|nr:signal peptidase I [Pleurocapsa minor GSE-CHR-MK 17-07R]